MKSLVVYFSHTGQNYMRDGIKNIEKGNTEIVAETIGKITGADIFKIETIKEYPYEYSKCCDEAKMELSKNERPKLKNKIEDISSYDVIYIGGPVWYGHFPMAIFSCLEDLDFSGKTVKPFSTHEGSYLGNVMEDVRKICKGADIKDGLAIFGSDAKSSKEKLEGWCI